MANPKVVVIGLDGMTPQLVEPWMKEGKLPNLARIAQEGAYGRLLSTMPPSSPQAWSSFLTGKNPGKHGIFGFDHRKPGTYTWALTTSRDRVGPDLGQIISARGGSAGFLFVPLTYPPYPVNGFMISGMGTPGPRAEFTYPHELKEELLQEFGGEGLFEPPVLDQEPLEYFSEVERFVERNHKAFEWFRNKFSDLDYYMVVFISPDRIQHFAWHFMEPVLPRFSNGVSRELRDAILRVYQGVDTAVGKIASSLEPETTLMVMSDHGAGPYRKFVDLNAWLAQQGVLTFAESVAQRSDTLLRQAYCLWRSGPRKLFSPWQRRRMREWLPGPLKTWIMAGWQNTRARQVDWHRTQAFSEGAGGLIRLNLRGREPQGVVRPEEREEVLRKIEGELYQLKDPETGEPVVERVWRREELYTGDATEKASDLIIEWAKELYHSRVEWDPQAPVFRDPHKWRTTQMIHSGHHQREGVIFAKGPCVATGKSLQGAEIVDLTPTILALMGLPLLPDFDGKVLKELTVGINDIRVEEVKVKLSTEGSGGGGYSEEERKQLEDMLRGLGYME
jgi:predicted AlkP superfamily phosphohydrolase/phosphomutase